MFERAWVRDSQCAQSFETHSGLKVSKLRNFRTKDLGSRLTVCSKFRSFETRGFETHCVLEVSKLRHSWVRDSQCARSFETVVSKLTVCSKSRNFETFEQRVWVRDSLCARSFEVSKPWFRNSHCVTHTICYAICYAMARKKHVENRTPQNNI